MSRALQAGLGGASNADIERAVEMARNAHDARSMCELRANLDKIMERPGARILTRKSALALLRAISDGLKPSTDKPIGRFDDTTILENHPAIELLDELIDALSDLDRGVPHPAFKTVAGNASLGIRKRQRDELLLRAVSFLEEKHGLKSRAEAERMLARNARKLGSTRDGKPITAGLLRRLRYNSKTRKPFKI
jgi:hypothetical protein